MADDAYKTKADMLKAAQEFPGNGTLTIIGIPGNKFQILERKIIKSYDCTDRQRKAMLELVEAFGSLNVRVIARELSGMTLPDRAEVLIPR